MTEQEIRTDRSKRADECKVEIESVLKKYSFSLAAEDNWTPNTKVRIEISFVDLKRYDAAVAEPSNVTTSAQLNAPLTAGPVSEGVQADGSVVINPESLK